VNSRFRRKTERLFIARQSNAAPHTALRKDHRALAVSAPSTHARVKPRRASPEMGRDRHAVTSSDGIWLVNLINNKQMLWRTAAELE
jgi:hypothetical protein